MLAVKRIVRRLIGRVGARLQLLSKDSHGPRTSVRETYELMRSLGFYPRTVIDVGVAEGTPSLYEAFPEAHFLLIEPLAEFEPSLISILMRYSGDYVLAAAGSDPGEITFNVHTGHLEGSSAYKESMGPQADGVEITVPVVRIDDVLEEKGLQGTILLKVDVQGAELDVLDGSQKALKEAEAVVLEVSLFKFMKGAPDLYEVVAYMNQRDFVVYDIIHGWNRPLDNALGQVDIVFVKDRGIFRQNHAYSTVSQLEETFGRVPQDESKTC